MRPYRLPVGRVVICSSARYLRGKNILKHPTGRWRMLAMSAVAVPLHAVASSRNVIAGATSFHEIFASNFVTMEAGCWESLA